jgi:acyl-coenzyme A thioesterase PaaI-like protein
MSTPIEVPWAPSGERHELGEALRRLLDVVVQTAAPPSELRAAATVVDELTARLGRQTFHAGTSAGADSYRDQMSLVGGTAHPIAPQLLMADHEGGAEGVVVVGPLFQGGPGLVHGGVLALLIDHAMGYVATRPERAAMTVRLSLRFRRPTPLGVQLAISVRLDRIEGRKLHLSATIATSDEVTVEAEAIFLILTAENLETVFGRVG